MTLSRILTALVVAAAVFSLMTKSDAQVVHNERGHKSATLPSGMEFSGNVYSLKLRGGAYAPLVMGFLSSPQVEPTLPSDHRAVWPICEGPANAVRCGFRFNYFGTILDASMGEWDTQ